MASSVTDLRITRLRSSSSSPMIFLPSLEYIFNMSDPSSLSTYDTYLLDMWGVLHDGTVAYEGAVDAVRKLKERGGRIMILSNSSKRKEEGIKLLGRLGFDVERDIDEVITSGEVSFQMLSGDESIAFSWPPLASILSSSSSLRPPRALVLGSGAGDAEYLRAAGWTLSGPSDADLVVARGTFTIDDGTGAIVSKSKGYGEGAYESTLGTMLRSAASRSLPMLVTNPDRVRPDADLSPMPGTIADAYEKILGETMAADDARRLVRRIGKPHTEVYELALRKKENIRGKASIMIGDALATDVAGSGKSNIDSVWVVRDGIHFKDIRARIENGLDYEDAVLAELEQWNRGDVVGDYAAQPTFCVPNFKW